MFVKENLDLIVDNLEQLTENDTIVITKIALKLRNLKEHNELVKENEKLDGLVKLIRDNSEERQKISLRLTMLYDMGNDCEFLTEELNKVTGYYIEKRKTLVNTGIELNKLLAELT